MATKLYVGNLPFGTTEDQLKELFGRFGDIASIIIMKDKFTGRSRGFGFVEMVAQEAATEAVAQVNGTELDGRKIVVNEARPLEDRPPRRFDDRGDRGGYDRNDRGGSGRRGGGYRSQDR